MLAADREFFEERAGIAEYCGAMPRAAAEAQAARETEAHRAACEARHVAGMPDDEARAGFLRQVEKHRGKEAADALRRAAWEIVKRKGNH